MPESFPITLLPDKLMLSCLARVSRLYYPSLSLVCKRFKSLLASPELYKTRSLLQCTESCLYVCLHFPPDPYPHWFTLRHKPNQTLTSKNKKHAAKTAKPAAKDSSSSEDDSDDDSEEEEKPAAKKAAPAKAASSSDSSDSDEESEDEKPAPKKESSGNVLAPVPSLRSPLEKFSCLVALGSNIYSIAEPIKPQASSSVSILDCRSHTWRKAPSLMVKRLYPCASVIDGKIYVGGGYCEDGDFETLSSIEVFDSKTQTWDQVSSPNWKLHRPRSLYRSACVEGKFHLMNWDGGLTYDSNEGRWDLVEAEMVAKNLFWSYCTIDNVLYSYYEREFKWYDTKMRLWKKLKGLVGLPKFHPLAQVRLTDYGGKMAVLWEKNLHSSGRPKRMMIWCAEITLKRLDGDEILGKVEWVDGVLPIPRSFFYMKVLAPTL